MIDFQNISRCYGRKVAVDRLTLSIKPGELFALLGPNGAGKTTTIKMLVGLLRPNEGSIRILGHDIVDETRDATRLTGYVPDELFLYDKLTGREFLEFTAEMRGLGRAETEKRIARENENFNLGEFIDRLAESYSHGMKQRLVFAAAMLHDPKVLVVDEPMVGLDPRHARVVKDLLRSRVDAGTTVFMSTHTLAVAEEIADRIGIVNEGRLHFLGTVSELRSQFASPETSLESLFLRLTDGDNGQGSEIPDSSVSDSSVSDSSLSGESARE